MSIFVCEEKRERSKKKEKRKVVGKSVEEDRGLTIGENKCKN